MVAFPPGEGNHRAMSEEQQAGSSEQELLRVRREKLDALVAKGVDPFGGSQGHETTHQPGVLREGFAEDQEVKVAGRIVSFATSSW